MLKLRTETLIFFFFFLGLCISCPAHFPLAHGLDKVSLNKRSLNFVNPSKDRELRRDKAQTRIPFFQAYREEGTAVDKRNPDLGSNLSSALKLGTSGKLFNFLSVKRGPAHPHLSVVSRIKGDTDIKHSALCYKRPNTNNDPEEKISQSNIWIFS